MTESQINYNSKWLVFQKITIAIAIIIFLKPLLFGEEPFFKHLITGLWVSSASDDNPEMIYIDEDKFSVLLDNHLYAYPWFLNNDFIMLPTRLGEKGIRYKLKDNRLTLEWDNGETTEYVKSPANNTLDHILAKHDINIELPSLHHFNVIENLKYYSSVIIAKNNNGDMEYYVDNNRTDLNELKDILSVRKKAINTFERNNYSVLLQIDKNIPMSKIMELRNEVSWTTLNYGYAGYPEDGQISKLYYDRTAILVNITPPDKPEIDKTFYANTGINVITINVNNFKNSMELSPDILKEQLVSSKYMVVIEYNKVTSYQDYIKILGLVHRSIYSMRNDMAMEMHCVPYEVLGESLKSNINRIYPFAISEKYLSDSYEK